MKNVIPVLTVIALAWGLTGCSKEAESKTKVAISANSSQQVTNTTPPVEEKVDFKLKWMPKKKYTVRVESVQSWEPKNTEKPTKQSLILAHDYAITPLEAIASGGQGLDWELVAEKTIYQVGPAVWLNFDSGIDKTKDVANPAAPLLRKLIGAKIHCELDSQGNIAKVNGFKELHARLGNEQPMLQPIIKSLYTEDNFRQLAGFVKLMQSGESLPVGGEWPVHLEMPDRTVTQIIELTCRFKGWETYDEHRCARIEFDGTVAAQPPASGKMITDLQDGKITGRILFDPALGMVITSSSDQHMVFKTTVPKPLDTQCHVTTNVRLVQVTDL